MTRLISWPLMGLAVMSSASAMDNRPRGREIAPARDGNIAIREELCFARQAATLEAYDRFILRHPTHPLAATARNERARLKKKIRPPLSDCPS